MRTIINLLTVLALLALSLGASVIPASASFQNQTITDELSGDTSFQISDSGVIKEIWPVVFSQANTGTAGWDNDYVYVDNLTGISYGTSVALDVPYENDSAEVEVLNDPVSLVNADCSSPDRAAFYGQFTISVDSSPASSYLNLYCDKNTDGITDYTLRTEMQAGEGSGWVKFSAVNSDWQILSEEDVHGLPDGSTQDWNSLISNDFADDKIFGISISILNEEDNEATGLAVDALTLGDKTYDLDNIQNSINRASSGDTLVVHPGSYHGAEPRVYVYPEFLYIDKSLTLESSNEYYNLTGEGVLNPIVIPDNSSIVQEHFADNNTPVVLISASDVILSGFSFFNNADLKEKNPVIGIAVDSLTDNALSNIEVSHNTLVLEEVSNPLGILAGDIQDQLEITNNRIFFDNDTQFALAIGVDKCDNAVIKGNYINLNVSGSDITAIWCSESEKADISNNEIIINNEYAEDQFWVDGIYFDTTRLIKANNNKISLSGVGYDCGLEGIGIWNDNWNTPGVTYFERADISSNTITANFTNPSLYPVSEINSQVLLDDISNVEMYGIFASNGNLLKSKNNIINLNANCVGLAYIEGLTSHMVYEGSTIDNNTISVEGIIRGKDFEVVPQYLKSGRSIASSVTSFKQDILGIAADTGLDVAAEVYGIQAEYADNPEILNNKVNIEMVATNVLRLSDNETDDNTTSTSTGLSLAVGVDVWSCDNPYIEENDIEVISQLLSGVTSRDTPEQMLDGNGVAAALGVLAHEAPNLIVTQNKINAVADGVGGAVGRLVYTDNQVLGSIQSGILDNLYSAVNEIAAETGEIDLKITQNDLSIDSLALFGVLGVGILAYNSPDPLISNNNPVTGIALGDVIAISADQYQVYNSGLAAGASLGMGGGILLINCGQARVMDNGQGSNDQIYSTAKPVSIEKDGRDSGVIGYSDVILEVLSQDNGSDNYSVSAGLNAGISFGILVIDLSDLIGSDSETVTATITGNQIASYGEASTIFKSSSGAGDSLNLSAGINIGLRLGIATLADTSDIENNIVISRDDSTVQSITESGEETDGEAIGVNVGLSVGITTLNGISNRILNNDIEAKVSNSVQTFALEGVEINSLDTEAIGGDLSMGVGLLIIGGSDLIVRGNTSQASSEASVIIGSVSDTPLDKADVTGLVANLSSGLILIGGSDTATVTENHFKTDGSALLLTMAGGDFIDTTIVGILLDIDVINLLNNTNLNYNDIGYTENINTESNSIYVLGVSSGLLNIAGDVNARYNYWGDPTGPGGIGEGKGSDITEYLSTGTEYSWWLSHPVSEVLEDNTGYYGFGYPLKPGLNTLSVPMALDNSSWSDIVKMSDLNYEIAYYYDPTQEYPWQQVLEDDLDTENDESYIVQPLNGMYVKMNSMDTIFFTSGKTPSVPLRELTQGQSWYLIGPTPYDDNYPFTTEMDVESALGSIMLTPDGLSSLVQVVSPSIGGQSPWVWSSYSNSSGQKMELGKAYWVFIENPDTLAGFIFTPMPPVLPINPANPS